MPNTHIRSHNNSLLCLSVSLFTPGAYQDCEEASGDGLIVSGNRSAGAGAGEKCAVCEKQIFFFGGGGGGIYVSLISVRWEQCRPNTGACQIVGQRCQKTVSQCCLPGEPQCGLFKMKAHARPATRNDPRMQGFMGIRRPVLACDSPLFFMLGKPSITTLTQNKPQSGLMLRFSCFSCFFFSKLVRAAGLPKNCTGESNMLNYS